jgi:hypothetical protein
MLSVTCHAAAWIKGRVAQDPPSRRYDSRTRAFRRSLALEEFIAPQDTALRAGFAELTPAPEVGSALAQTLLDESAQVGAFIRAFERAQGAQLADERAFLDARARESRDYARRASALLRDSAGLAANLATSLEGADVSINATRPRSSSIPT